MRQPATSAFRALVPHALRARLTTGLVLLLAAACLTVGVSTVWALDGFLVRQLDQQLTASGGRFAASLEHERRIRPLTAPTGTVERLPDRLRRPAHRHQPLAPNDQDQPLS